MSELADTLDDLGLLIARVETSISGRTFEELMAIDEAYVALTYRLSNLSAEF